MGLDKRISITSVGEEREVLEEIQKLITVPLCKKHQKAQYWKHVEMFLTTKINGSNTNQIYHEVLNEFV